MLAIIWHSRTGASAALATAAAQGAASAEPDLTVNCVPAAEVTPAFLLSAQGYIFACPENLGSMSGAMKEMFDRCFYPLLGRVEGRAYATLIAAGSDGQGAQTQLDRIVSGWRLRRVADPVIVNVGAQRPETILAKKNISYSDIYRAEKLGQSLAAGLAMGLF